MNTRHFRSLWLIVIGLLLGSKQACAATYSEDQIKAVYLYRIVSFIYWEAEEQMDSINICLPDSQNIRSLLSEIAQGKTVRDKPIRITNDNCNLVYMTQRSSLSLLNSYPKSTVTVSDVTRFTDYGGAVELATKAGRIKPKVNLGNLGSYRISSNLLRVSDVEGELR